jgi:3-oxoacyl-[acyl-carrier-protein] synthase-3
MLFIHGTGHFHPDTIIDNAFLESLNIDTNESWILERVGIQQRRTCLSLDYIRSTYNDPCLPTGPHRLISHATMGAQAAQMALDRAGILPQQIGWVISGSSSAQYLLPAAACMIAAELGISCPAFDVNSACATFAIQMHLLNQMNANTLPDYILLVIPESMTTTVNFHDRSVAVLWGDGAAAVIVSKKHPSPWQVSDTYIASDPENWQKVQCPVGQHFFQEGSAVQKFAIKKTLALLEQLKASDTSYFIGHQANLSMLTSVCRMAQIPDHYHLYNVDQFGNCGAAGAPSVLSQRWSHFQSGNTIVMCVVGAGLTWGGLSIRYQT